VYGNPWFDRIVPPGTHLLPFSPEQLPVILISGRWFGASISLWQGSFAVGLLREAFPFGRGCLGLWYSTTIPPSFFIFVGSSEWNK
tara:strand:- start:2621 stop:2878 length:258 start_codon:yes stop_codon:yes gene_type:complete